MKKTLIFIVLSSLVLANTITFKGDEVTLNSKGIKVGEDAPEFTVVSKDFTEVKVGGKKDKVQVIAFLPSFDSSTCKLETIAFNNKVSQMKNVVVTVISKDLPFAIGKFCKNNKITNVMT